MTTHDTQETRMSTETTSGGQGGAARMTDAAMADWLDRKADAQENGTSIRASDAARLRSVAEDLRRASAALKPTPAREAPTDNAALVEEVAGELRTRAAWWRTRGMTDDGLRADARAILALVTRAVAGRARREALEEAARQYDDHPFPVIGPATVAAGLRRLAAAATDDTEGQS